MAEVSDKENESPRRSSRSPKKTTPISTLKWKADPRRRSIGPGLRVLSPVKATPQPITPDIQYLSASPEAKTQPAFTEIRGESTITFKSILPSKGDEVKRREARRKSLANRRVSFAPEATLHTWDVIEYVRDATVSSTDSAQSPRKDDGDDETVPATPDNQSRAQQKKRRRSSVIPPLNFNDPDDLYSSSPANDSSPVADSDGEEELDDEAEEVDYDEGSPMDLDSDDERTGTLHSFASDSSAQLTARLELAANTAGTRGPFFDEFGYVQEEDPVQEQVAQQSWEDQQSMLTPMAKNLIALQEQENVNPFSPAFRNHAGTGRPSTIMEEQEDDDGHPEDEEDDQDASMDFTRAVGGIKTGGITEQTDGSFEDVTMDFTQVGGRIFVPSPAKNAMKRRRSTTDTGSPMTNPRQNDLSGDLNTSAKRKRHSDQQQDLDDGTMDFTRAYGSIKPPLVVHESTDDATMEFTRAIGGIVRSRSPLKVSRRQSVRQRRSSAFSMMSPDKTMEFTTAFGGIKQVQISPLKSVGEADSNEDMSMELTITFGTINQNAPEQARPATPEPFSSPLRENPPASPDHDGHFTAAVDDESAKKLLTPPLMREVTSPARVSSPARSVAASVQATPNKVTERARASMSPTRTPLKLPPPKNATPQSIKASPQANLYPILPEAESALPTTPSPRRSPRKTAVTTPMQAPSTPQRQSSPPKKLESPFKDLKASVTRPSVTASPVKTEDEVVAAPKMLDNILTMATPRKEANATPLKRLKEMTPRKTPLKTPLRTPLGSRLRTPRAAVTPRVHIEPIVEEVSATDDDGARELTEDLRRNLEAPAAPAVPVTLNSFLDEAGIKFMDLTATKRRYTVAPTPYKTSADRTEDSEVSTYEDSVAAGACIVPELELYQHSCRELKQYMSEGKTFLKQLEAEVAADPPPFMKAYMAAKPEQKGSFDRLIADAKTKSRLHSKKLWYGWRSQVLIGLQDGLKSIEKGLDADANELAERQAHVDEVLPPALAEKEALLNELATLQEQASNESPEDKEALAEAREELLALDATVIDQREVLAQLRQEMDDAEREAEFLIDSKTESAAAIDELCRVKEASRSISAAELTDYQASIAALEKSTNWSISSADGSGLTMAYRSALQLYFNPTSFSSGLPSSSPISLTYIASKPMTTELRFFLQLLRASLHALAPASTSPRAVLSFLARAWDTATSVSATISRLSLEQPVDVTILSDETLNVQASVLLHSVKTKVDVSFEITASTAQEGRDVNLTTSVASAGRIVYGEAYKEDKMGDFLSARVGMDLSCAETAVRDLRARLEKTGRKN